MTLRIGSLCSGYLGLDLGLHAVVGGELAWVADNDPAAAQILATRAPGVPNLGDITTLRWDALEPVDWLTAGFPCQDLSHAGKRAGMRPGNRSGLWFHIAYGISVLRPSWVLLENVRGLLSGRADRDMEPGDAAVGDGAADVGRALGVVLGDLADIGYDARWLGLPASAAGAPHGRFRVFIVAALADTGRICGISGRVAEPGQAPSRQSLSQPAGRRGAPSAADADELGLQGRGDAGGGEGLAGAGQPTDLESAGSVATAADPERGGRAGWTPEPQWDSVERTPAGGSGQGGVQWGTYEPAIRQWERILGRPAPHPTERTRRGQRLAPAFSEWLMGLPTGWVTDVAGIDRNAQLRALGNGVVPQQARLAVRTLLAQWMVAAS